jgi:molecular chaperone GrpE (heat shock protein)
VEPEFIIDEQCAQPPESPVWRGAAVEAIRREYQLRTELSERNVGLTGEQRRTADFLRRLIAAKESRCDELLRVERERAGFPDAPDPCAAERAKWLRRVELVQKALDRELEAFEVTRYEPSGAPVPERDAIKGSVAAAGLEPGVIVKVIRPAYLWRGAVLCPAEVLISE